MEDSKTLFCSSKFPWASERISLNFINYLSRRPQKGSPALVCVLLCVRNQVSHPYKTTDVIIVLCFSACVVRQQTLRRVKLKSRGVDIPRFYCDIRFACFVTCSPC